MVINLENSINQEGLTTDEPNHQGERGLIFKSHSFLWLYCLFY